MTSVTRGDAAPGAYEPSAGCPPPHPHPRTPSILLPPGSCDSHCHIFGPGDVFPYAPDRTFTPVDVPRQQVAQLHRFLGFSRAVIVQSSCNGTDHSVLLDALAAGDGDLRGVALIDEQTPAAEIARLHDAGVRGLRLNFLPHLRQPPDRQEVATVLGKVADRGWHAEIHVAGRGVVEHGDLIRGIAAPVVIDHLGRVDLAEGLDGPSVRALKALLDTGKVWVKVSGADRVSKTGPPYADAVALGALLVRYAPDRVLWGTDFPHPNIVGDAPDDGLLTDLLGELAPTHDLLERLLVSNPAAFFDF
ncbi:amidohydrolase family protein [Actinoplanes sp. NPDC026619]|uniref:amidohydrolase family protein n=1 Tax=Actinoplanes sp. NPDC026619 TaxID=3155798 RepID=UPI0033E628A3